MLAFGNRVRDGFVRNAEAYSPDSIGRMQRVRPFQNLMLHIEVL
jgi:hypothetical protein